MSQKDDTRTGEAAESSGTHEQGNGKANACCSHLSNEASIKNQLDRRDFIRSAAGATLVAGVVSIGSMAAGSSEAKAAGKGSLRERTAVVIVDPYNDFLSEQGAFWPLVATVVQSVGVVENLKKLLGGARSVGVQVVYAPHRRYREGDYSNWKFRNWSHNGIMQFKGFAHGTPRGEFRDGLKAKDGDLIASEHWSASGFANTDLNQILQQHGIDHIALAGMLTNTCVEATGREAVELGYHVTMVKDAVGCMSPDEQKAAIELSYPRFAHAILTTNDFLATLA